MARPKHTDKDIEAAVAHAEQQSWSFKKASGHAWGLIRCRHNDRRCRSGQFCQISIWSTPRNPGNEARRIRRLVDKCIHATPRAAPHHD